MNLVNSSNKTMSSIDLRDVINEARVSAGESRVRNNDLLSRIEDELEGELGDYESFTHPQSGAEMRYYNLTMDQCVLVGMRESKAVRRSVLEKLNGMVKTLSPSEILLMHAQRLVDMEREQEALKAQVSALVDGENYFTIVGYCNLIAKRLPQKETARLGKLASAYCKANDIEMGGAVHPLYGRVNTYPFEVLEIVVGVNHG